MNKNRYLTALILIDFLKRTFLRLLNRYIHFQKSPYTSQTEFFGKNSVCDNAEK